MSQEPTPAPAPTPILYGTDGQPIDAATAAAERASLLGNPTYAKEALTDPEKQRHLKNLWQLERGIQPPPAETVEQVQQQTTDRLERDRLMHASALRSAAEGITDEQVRQIQLGRPIPREERGIAVRHLAALQRDKDFVRRYLDGDRQAALEMKLTAIAARGMPVGTLEDIRAWEAAHPSPVRR